MNESNYTKDDCEYCGKILAVLFFIYAIPSLLAVYDGFRDAARAPHKCTTSLTEMDFIYPSYRVGCWLNSITDTYVSNLKSKETK